MSYKSNNDNNDKRNRNKNKNADNINIKKNIDNAENTNNMGSGSINEYRQTFSALVQRQWDCFTKMMRALDLIQKYDEELVALCDECRPEPDKLRFVTTQKERLTEGLDKLSICVSTIQPQLESIISLCHELESGEEYRLLCRLQELTYLRLRQVLRNEDIQNPAIIGALTDYKESLELDKMISEIPAEKRKFFYMFKGTG